MKKIVSFFAIFILVSQVSLFAQGKVATPTAQENGIQQLKDKLEEKVVELQKKDQKAITGIVSENKKSTVTIKSADGTVYRIKIDNVITKLYDVASGDKKEFKIDDLEKGDFIIVSGPVSDQVATANNIYRDVQYLMGSGKITEANATDFFLKVLTPEKETLTLDVEDSTKRFLIDVKTFEAETIGFAKIKEGDTIHYVVKRTGTEREKNRYSATKILIIPQEYFQK